MRETIIEWATSAYQFLFPFCIAALLIDILIALLGLAIRPWRAWIGFLVMISSYVFGLTLWLLSCAITFATFGWIGLIVGLFLFGVGVFPMALWGAFARMEEPPLGWLLVGMFAVLWIARAVAVNLMASAGERNR